MKTYQYCGICGHVPQTSEDEPNTIERWWDCDNGWKIGALCPGCKEENEGVEPDPEDYAYKYTNGILDCEPETDEDIIDILTKLELGI
jgi:hypothetical protein